ncbi:MAG: hypothetical protein Q9225_006654 [Loekoesia sp. 1 TL-2023]
MPPPDAKRTPLPPQQYLAPSTGKGAKGYPKRKGPPPARHIPWPEIFRHHISLVEGHLKMIEMVRKHTIEGSGNHRTISELVSRSKEMLWQAKSTARTFVPPPNLFEQVPLGSSSDTMYPGYSPGHFEYGKAAEEFGRYASEARKKGIEVKPEGMDYKLGQSKGLAHMNLAQIRAANAEKTDAGSGSENEPQAAKGKENHETEDQMFFMDSNPTPVNVVSAVNSSVKRKATPEPVEANIPKRQKKKHSDQSAGVDGVDRTVDEPVRVEFEDISGEVDARLKEKEERRKRKQQIKEEKKRKRESEGSSAVIAEASSTVDLSKPKKKKTRQAENDGQAGLESLKKRSTIDDEEAAEGSTTAIAAEKPKSKRVKVSQEGTTKEKKQKHDLTEDRDGDESSGKRKKAKNSEGTSLEEKQKKRKPDGETTAEIGEPEGKKKKRRKDV